MIGQNIRKTRQRQGLSLNGLAHKSGFSKGFLSKIENGHAKPPVATLMRIAAALDTTINRLFDGIDSAAGRSTVLTRADQRQHIGFSDERGYGFDRLVVGSDFRMSPYIFYLTQDQCDPPGFTHSGEEMIFVLDGELDYRVGDEVIRLRVGDTLMFDANLPHGPIRLPNQDASVLAVFGDDAARGGQAPLNVASTPDSIPETSSQ